MIKKDEKYYVYDTLNNKFLMIDGERAEVNGIFAKEMDNTKMSFLEFIDKRDIDKFNENLRYGLK